MLTAILGTYLKYYSEVCLILSANRSSSCAATVSAVTAGTGETFIRVVGPQSRYPLTPNSCLSYFEKLPPPI